MIPLIGAALTSGAAGLAGTYLSNQASSAQAQRQMDFQQDMSNTAHQREVADLRAAGLNPILSAMGNGASSPQGAQGSVADLGSGIQNGINTGIAIRAQNKEFEKTDAGIANTDADTKNKNATSGLISAQTTQSAAEARLKSVTAGIAEKIGPSQIKKAIVDGDFAKAEKIMGLLNSGLTSANSIKNLVPGVGDLLKGTDLNPGKTRPLKIGNP